MLLQLLKKNTLSKLCVWRVFALTLLGLLLAGCSQQHQEYSWEGQWQRTITVPRGVQGRCMTEDLHIKKRVWLLQVTLYPTYECKDAYLQLFYRGTLRQVAIRKDTSERALTLHVEKIHMNKMVDILAGNYTELSGQLLGQMAISHIEPQYRQFEQTLWMAKDKNSLLSNIYGPPLQTAIPDYPNKQAQLLYRRVGNIKASSE